MDLKMELIEKPDVRFHYARVNPSKIDGWGIVVAYGEKSSQKEVKALLAKISTDKFKDQFSTSPAAVKLVSKVAARLSTEGIDAVAVIAAKEAQFKAEKVKTVEPSKKSKGADKLKDLMPSLLVDHELIEHDGGWGWCKCGAEFSIFDYAGKGQDTHANHVLKEAIKLL